MAKFIATECWNCGIYYPVDNHKVCPDCGVYHLDCPRMTRNLGQKRVEELSSIERSRIARGMTGEGTVRTRRWTTITGVRRRNNS